MTVSSSNACKPAAGMQGTGMVLSFRFWSGDGSSGPNDADVGRPHLVKHGPLLLRIDLEGVAASSSVGQARPRRAEFCSSTKLGYPGREDWPSLQHGYPPRSPAGSAWMGALTDSGTACSHGGAMRCDRAQELNRPENSLLGQ